MPILDDVELEHFGVKGMHWGVRKSEESSGDKEAKTSGKKKAAIIIASAVGVAAVLAGAAYVLHRNGVFGDILASDVSVKDTAKKFAESMAQEPVGIVHSARTKRKGFTFPQRGGLSDPFTEWSNAGFTSDGDSRNVFRRYGSRLEKVAAEFDDPHGRLDQAGRLITHTVMLPEGMAKNVHTLEDVVNVAWPLIKDKFDAMYDS